MTCSQGPRYLAYNVCGSTTSNCVTDNSLVDCPDCLHILATTTEGPWGKRIPKSDTRYVQWKSDFTALKALAPYILNPMGLAWFTVYGVLAYAIYRFILSLA